MPSYTHLNAVERDQLASLRARGLGIRASAREMGRSPSTISRELRRNAPKNEFYRPDLAARRYLRRRRRSVKLERDAALRDYVIARLSEGWSPEQISGRLGTKIEKGLGRIAHETIYSFIYRRGQKAQKLWRYLVRRRAKRRPLAARASRDGIKSKVHVSERPDTANTREEAGHWEADLVICKHARPLLVLHERKTRLTLMTRMLGKTAGETVAKIQAILKRLAPSMRGSITFDNGTEFAQHALLRGMLKHTTYFCDAYASWQKGGVENANGRIKRWLPRRTDLDELTEQDIQDVSLSINLTPRKCLGYRTPIEAFLFQLGKDVEIRFG